MTIQVDPPPIVQTWGPVWLNWIGRVLYPRIKNGPFHLDSYTVATAPNAALHESAIIYISDETGGAVVAFSDGTNWRRVTDRAVIS